MEYEGRFLDILWWMRHWESLKELPDSVGQGLGVRLTEISKIREAAGSTGDSSENTLHGSKRLSGSSRGFGQPTLLRHHTESAISYII
jgi:hypothetical protein